MTLQLTDSVAKPGTCCVSALTRFTPAAAQGGSIPAYTYHVVPAKAGTHLNARQYTRVRLAL